MSEKLSNPERVEKRRPANASKAQAAPGQSVVGNASAGGADDSEKAGELSGFESTLKRVDDWLGGS